MMTDESVVPLMAGAAWFCSLSFLFLFRIGRSEALRQIFLIVSWGRFVYVVKTTRDSEDDTSRRENSRTERCIFVPNDVEGVEGNEGKLNVN